jgi:zinc transport system substrate-binding protein
MMSQKFTALANLIIIALIAWAAFCGLATAAAPPARVPVAATILPLGDFCRHIGGDLVDVTVLIPAGASPHAFEPSPGAVAKAIGARVMVYNGAGLDPWAERLVRSQKNPSQVVVKAVAGLPLIGDVVEHGHGEDGGGKNEAAGHQHHGAGNPHVWLDPELAQDICRRIAQALIQVDPAHSQAYETNLASYINQLQDLDRDIKAAVAGFHQKHYVCFHNAYAYFSRRYGLKEVGVIEAAPGREPSPGQLQRIIAAIRKSGVKAVFAEPQLSSRVAEVIAQEAGVKVLVLDPLGGRPPYGPDYIKLMRHNLAILTQAMQ